MNRARELLSFAGVGVAGFVVDAGLMNLISRLFLIPDALARVPSFCVAVVATWLLNSLLTFRGVDLSFKSLQKYFGTNSIGFVTNWLVFLLATHFFEVAHAFPTVTLAIAALFSLLVNFTLAKRFVFKK